MRGKRNIAGVSKLRGSRVFVAVKFGNQKEKRRETERERESEARARTALTPGSFSGVLMLVYGAIRRVSIR